MAGIGFGTNYDAFAGNGLGPQTRIVNLAKTNMTQQSLMRRFSIYKQLMLQEQTMHILLQVLVY